MIPPSSLIFPLPSLLEIFIKPSHIVIQPSYPVLWLPSTREVVVLFREENQFHFLSKIFERCEKPEPLDHPATIVFHRVNYEQGCLDVRGVSNRRHLLELISSREQITSNLILRKAWPNVRSAKECFPACDASICDRGLENVGVADCPVGHESAV